MIKVASVVEVERKCAVAGMLEIVVPDSHANICRTKASVGVFQDGRDADAGSIEQKVVQLAGVVIVEGERPVIGGLQIEAANSVALVYRS